MAELGANGKTIMAELHQLLLIDGQKGASVILDRTLSLYQLLEKRGSMAGYIALTSEVLAPPDDAGEKITTFSAQQAITPLLAHRRRVRNARMQA